MKNFIEENLSDKFHKKGAMIKCVGNSNIHHLDYSSIVKLFEERGIVTFRDFEINPESILEFTNKYTKLYAADANRRTNLFGKKNINTVDLGNHEMPLHSEASYSPSWPEIIWFFCVVPSSNGGETTVCDGIKLWKALPEKIKDFFQSNPLHFELEFPVVKKNTNKENRPWSLNAIGSSNGILDYKKGVFIVKQTRFAVSETRLLNELAFANHLLIIFENEPQITKLSLANGEKIPKSLIDEVNNISRELIYDINWKKNDLVMLDNKRFMHGRRAYKEKVDRKIINIQTLQANFSFGQTSRD